MLILERGVTIVGVLGASSGVCLLLFLHSLFFVILVIHAIFKSVKLSSFVYIRSHHVPSKSCVEQRIEKFILAKRDKARFVVWKARPQLRFPHFCYNRNTISWSFYGHLSVPVSNTHTKKKCAYLHIHSTYINAYDRMETVLKLFVGILLQ